MVFLEVNGAREPPPSPFCLSVVAAPESGPRCTVPPPPIYISTQTGPELQPRGVPDLQDGAGQGWCLHAIIRLKPTPAARVSSTRGLCWDARARRPPLGEPLAPRCPGLPPCVSIQHHKHFTDLFSAFYIEELFFPSCKLLSIPHF